MPHPPLLEAVEIHAPVEACVALDATPGAPRTALLHPQKWSEDHVRDWWERRTKRRQVEALSKGTDGRNIMRWTVSRFEQPLAFKNQIKTSLKASKRSLKGFQRHL